MNNIKKEEVAVVTGAGGTLCSELAVDLARKGYRVALIGRSLEKLRKDGEDDKRGGRECFVRFV